MFTLLFVYLYLLLCWIHTVNAELTTMTSVFSNVTSWLGGSRERDSSPEGEQEIGSNQPAENEAETSQDPVSTTEGGDSATDQSKQEETTIGIPIDVQEVSEKALYAAKEWGSE